MTRIFFILQLCVFLAEAQDNKMSNYYSSPLNIPLSLAGNFCEIRTNHFHSGIDLRTYGREGYPVFAAAEGFISRIKVSAIGYGNALYLTHPNGTVTVYGHLRQFTDAIAKYVEMKQREIQNFEVELFPDSSQFIIKRDEQIALSGNSGGSEAPHLHFEIRDRYTEEPLNPLLYGIQIKDTMFPVITHVAVYENASGEYKRLTIKKTRAVNDSVFEVDDTIKTSFNISNISLSFAAYDKAFLSDSNDVNIYGVTLVNDADTVFNYNYDRMNFNETKYVNAHIDYEARLTHKLKLERCFRLPGDGFASFNKAGTGIISFTNTNIINPKLKVRDFHGHTSTLLLEIARDLGVTNETQIFSDTIQHAMLDYNHNHFLKSKNATLRVTQGNLYQNIPAKKIIEMKIKKYYSPLIKVFNKTIPLHKGAAINIRAKNIPASLQSKAVIASLNDQNKITGYAGGIYNKGWVTTKISAFGNYAVTVDTTPPLIKQMEITIDSICMCALLSVKITDDLSGIKNYIGCIDNEWALMEWDKKNEQLLYYIKPELMGPHQITLQASDQKGNWVYFERYF